MARPRTFDDDTALDAAVACFWRTGLDGTSVRHLAVEMGIAGPSLYNAFGDKRALFLLALERYMATSRARLADFEAAASPKAALATFFRSMIDRSLDDPERRGCFLINTALEVAPGDPELGRSVSGYFGEIEAFLRQRVAAAVKAGEIAATIDPRDTGRMLLGLLVALRVLARTGAGRAQLEGMLRPALAMLDQPLAAQRTSVHIGPRKPARTAPPRRTTR